MTMFRVQTAGKEFRFESMEDGTWRKVIISNGPVQMTEGIERTLMLRELWLEIHDAVDKHAEEVKERKENERRDPKSDP